MTDEPTITRAQAHAIAVLLRTLRPKWDELATTNYVEQVSAKRPTHDLADLVHGCLRTALDLQASTPAALLHDHPTRWTRSVRTFETKAEASARIQRQLDEREERRRELELKNYRGSDATAAAAARAQIHATLAASAERRRLAPEETR